MADNGISTKQKRLIASLLTSPTIEKAAETAGVGERTVYTWLSDVNFRAALREAQDRAIDMAVSRLVGGASEAADVLITIATNTAEKGSTRVAAARAVIEGMGKTMEIRDLAERLAVLEAKVNAQT